MTCTHILGFPRIGARRELKFALEKHWRGEIDASALEATGADLRARHWQAQRAAGLDFVTVGDFAYYDHVANHIQLLGCEPARFGFEAGAAELSRYFTMARGVAAQAGQAHGTHGAHCVHSAEGTRALEMTKWFDTNYHYLVPEFDAATQFHLNSTRLFDEVAQALALGHPVKAVLLGPLSFLWLGKEKQAGRDRFTRLEALLPVYGQVLARLKAQGVAWVQMDEPVLGLDLPDVWRHAFERAYWQLARSAPRLMLATYFSPLAENLRMACQLPVAGLHVDAVRAPEELPGVVDWLPAHKVLSVGIVDGRNIWRNDLDAALERLRTVRDKHQGELWIAPSCSLLHVPSSLDAEPQLDAEIKSWLACASEKLDELRVLRAALDTGAASVQAELRAARAALAARRASPRVNRADVALRVARTARGDDQRRSPFARRQTVQRARHALPALPTTTIGSFPQTADIRAARAAFKRGDLDIGSYRAKMRAAIALAVRKQEELGIDVLVHGEAERNDMVEYFGEQLDGFAFTANGWVQSYGSRCVKPPVIYGDVARPAPMTLEWTSYAQSLTQRPMKGMLTGPNTLLQWSFVRDDQPRSVTAEQIAWAMRDEVLDLEAAGIGIIQIDEPALREGLPLRRSGWKTYLAGAARAFRISASGVGDQTQIHTHMCYCEFNDILPEIAALDADVITIETSRSDMELLRGFGDFKYPNEIGPGIYDIHSPRVPGTDEMLRLMRKAAAAIPVRNLWINPDCGLKTRTWPETEAALAHMVAAARILRAETAPKEPADRRGDDRTG
ncbi:5-methyltetrahydropteroyltriglutamate--homocysteine S-methyltransferase [Verminephrobacter eiseniae]|uniref:5-methyltetrahydropteroyltriglutamate-- homocysteine S-methyltransferase n=1 Tax=Verminephrobacter eiseniae TaxID=364317 RepID=UPI002238EE80|nr:5-methyltetrahydropteroyltriglutamate--homocysteine S-methyltransferase [Verminephrobacter eiseniae]MCW5230413.1 5-methyltetrahydropteroyltriglutamate--homocysteine S-methyltransferase [Verminephrobacter eiseniae]MCW5260382.1 5-methyltetrahydropteroyltriglutamate--homocysteine S-methyltransferase [Verminephrobacter eiseniae]MCW5292147.1 5-methyltetrahydropteroyltriglutamate--homocysteine S-methyltransferase [Verminephrobacter eiseniae]MCW8187226.1 5-methyltetrahydropteroyltriglutamate--homoc